MAARFVAVALTFFITGAPVSAALCEAVCAGRSADAMHGGRGEHHSCHEAASSNQLEISGLPHTCGHAEGDDQLGADHPTKVLPQGIVASGGAPFVAAAFASEMGIAPRYVAHSPPGALALSTQLRI